MVRPHYLTTDESCRSKIALVAPARKINPEEIAFAENYMKGKGFDVVYDERLFFSYNQFAGTDEERASILQQYLDDTNIDAIMCVRGGYGTVRIIDKLHFDTFMQKPKWIVGYSDVTVLHAKIQSLGIQSLHATMPINFPNNTPRALDSLFDVMTGKKIKYDIGSDLSSMNLDAEIVGGNISVLYSLLGSDIFPNTDGKILFIEDLDEYLYHIDRMMMAFKRAGKLDNVEGLIVGGLTQMHDNNTPFGMSAQEIIVNIANDMNIPVLLNFPAGHINDNMPIVLGQTLNHVMQ